MKAILIMLFASASVFAAASGVDVYSPEELHSKADKLLAAGKPFASEQLKKYGTTHYSMLAVREQTGSSEVHEKESDIFLIVSGNASLLSGGKLVSPHTEKPGEMRGTSIEGGSTDKVTAGSVIHIPAGVPHQLIIPKGSQFSYFVFKVIEP